MIDTGVENLIPLRDVPRCLSARRIRRELLAPADCCGKSPERLSTIEEPGILVRDHAAARRWMVSVIAARALELHRERRKLREEEQAQEPDRNDDGNAHGTAERAQEGHRG